jgi:hypothetical protein
MTGDERTAKEIAMLGCSDFHDPVLGDAAYALLRRLHPVGRSWR